MPPFRVASRHRRTEAQFPPVSQQRLPLDLSVDPFYSVANQEQLKRSIERYEAGKPEAGQIVVAQCRAHYTSSKKG